MRWYEVTTRLMKDRKVRHSDVAAALGISRQAVSHKLSGIRPTTTDELEIIAGLLGVTMQDLVGGDVRYIQDEQAQRVADLFLKLKTGEQKDAFERALQLAVQRPSAQGDSDEN